MNDLHAVYISVLSDRLSVSDDTLMPLCGEIWDYMLMTKEGPQHISVMINSMIISSQLILFVVSG